MTDIADLYIKFEKAPLILQNNEIIMVFKILS